MPRSKTLADFLTWGLDVFCFVHALREQGGGMAKYCELCRRKRKALMVVAFSCGAEVAGLKPLMRYKF